MLNSEDRYAGLSLTPHTLKPHPVFIKYFLCINVKSIERKSNSQVLRMGFHKNNRTEAQELGNFISIPETNELITDTNELIRINS